MAEIGKSQFEALTVLKDSLERIPSLVYYPCCNTDSTPAHVFTAPETSVVFADLSSNAIDALQRDGRKALVANALEHNPGEVDVLILLNPAINPSFSCSLVRKGGLVACNNYHQTATQMRAMSDFQCRGVIRRDLSTGGLIYDTEELDLCWQEIQSDQDWEKAAYGFSTVTFERAKGIVLLETGRAENILENYRAILAKARQTLIERAEAVRNSPPKKYAMKRLPDGSLFPYFDEPLLEGETLEWSEADPRESAEAIERQAEYPFIPWTHKDGTETILTDFLPSKKGGTDDIFVFERVS